MWCRCDFYVENVRSFMMFATVAWVQGIVEIYRWCVFPTYFRAATNMDRQLWHSRSFASVFPFFFLSFSIFRHNLALFYCTTSVACAAAAVYRKWKRKWICSVCALWGGFMYFISSIHLFRCRRRCRCRGESALTSWCLSCTQIGRVLLVRWTPPFQCILVSNHIVCSGILLLPVASRRAIVIIEHISIHFTMIFFPFLTNEFNYYSCFHSISFRRWFLLHREASTDILLIQHKNREPERRRSFAFIISLHQIRFLRRKTYLVLGTFMFVVLILQMPAYEIQLCSSIYIYFSIFFFINSHTDTEMIQNPWAPPNAMPCVTCVSVYVCVCRERMHLYWMNAKAGQGLLCHMGNTVVAVLIAFMCLAASR